MLIKIDNSSKDLLGRSRDISVHDDILTTLSFNREESTLNLTIRPYIRQNLEYSYYTIEYVNVLGFEMTSCDFWLPSPRINRLCHVDPCEQKLIPKLYDIETQYSCDTPCKLESGDDFFETYMEFISGDILRVVSEYILFRY